MIEELYFPEDVIVVEPKEKDKPYAPCKQTELEFQFHHYKLHITLYHDHHMLQSKIVNDIPKKEQRMFPLLSVNNKSKVVMELLGKREQYSKDIEQYLSNIGIAQSVQIMFQSIIDKYLLEVQK